MQLMLFTDPVNVPLCHFSINSDKKNVGSTQADELSDDLAPALA